MRKTMYFVSLLVAFSILLAGCASPTTVPTQPVPTLMPTPVPTLGVGSTLIRAADGMVMVYVPEGSFIMGGDSEAGDNKKHTVTLDAYWIDQTEMTNGKYALCVKAGTCKPPVSDTTSYANNYYSSPEFADYPVVYVNWSQAKAYCEWAGGRLPTEAEWEKATRGTDGRTYSWGETMLNNTFANIDWSSTTKVGSYEKGKSPYGAYDMTGNVMEWVADWFNGVYYENSPANNPTGPENGEHRVVRDYDGAGPGIHTTYHRFHLAENWNGDYVGFRCASSPVP